MSSRAAPDGGAPDARGFAPDGSVAAPAPGDLAAVPGLGDLSGTPAVGDPAAASAPGDSAVDSQGAAVPEAGAAGFSARDHAHMARALHLAARGLYTTTPNPRVGCVLVKNDRVVGEGWHERAGEAHAEARAMEAAGRRARGATAYVTLEPCSHQGRTPPCADALLRAGVTRVVGAMPDPNPLVAGQGYARLRAAGLRVESGLLAAEAGELNRGFVSRMTRGRPWVTVKLAASLDGKTALGNGQSQWITGEDARRDGHRLRARSCAVLTGIGTVLADDPRLDVRAMETGRQPLRVVLDSRLRTPPRAAVLEGEQTLIVTTSDDEFRIEALKAAGAEIWVLADHDRPVPLDVLLQKLARRGVNELLVEAGQTLAGGFIAAGLVDELVLYLAPTLLGDAARGLLSLPPLTRMADRHGLEFTDLRRVGADLRITVRPRPAA